MESAIGQPAFSAGKRTVRSGDRILAVSAMKRTPQKTITGACRLGRGAGQFQGISYEIRDQLYLRALVGVGQDKG